MSMDPSPYHIPGHAWESTETIAISESYDSGFENDDTASIADSGFNSIDGVTVASSIYDYQYENGRRYHSYRSGTYAQPDDAQEQDRLNIFHHVFIHSSLPTIVVSKLTTLRYGFSCCVETYFAPQSSRKNARPL